MEAQPTVDVAPGSSDKPFRIVPSDSYSFGFDDSAKVKSRLIVKEKDAKYVREYDIEDGTNYYCIGCFKKSQTKKIAYIDDNHFLLAPTQHDCVAITLEESEFDQEMKKTMFLQSQSQSRSSMSLYPSSAVGNTSFANTSASSSKTSTPVNIIIKPSQPPPTDLFDGAPKVNKFSAALLDRSTCSSPEYIPETSPSASSPSTPFNYHALMPNAATSSLPSSPLIQNQSFDTTSEITNEASTPSNVVQTYNTAETPFEILQVQKSDKERKCAETPDSVYGHYLFNGFSGDQKAVKSDKGFNDDVTTSKNSTNLNDTLSVDISPCDDEHVAIPPEGYQYGYSWRTGSENKRIIVFEPNDKTKVRQYAGNGSYFWFCIDCFRIKKKKYKAFFEGEIFMAAKTHFCEPLSYEDAMKQQQEIIEKFGLNKPKPTTDEIQSITELGQESDNESIGRSRMSKRIRIPREIEDATPEIVVEETRLLPDYTYFNSLEKRCVKPEDYQYGVGFKNQTDGRIIVFEEHDRNYVREYSFDHKNTWYCRYCLRGNKKLYAFMKESIFCVPPSHNCQPKLYTAVMKEQQEIRARYTVANPHQNLLSPGSCLSNVAPVRPFFSAEGSPSSMARSPRQRSINSQSSISTIKSSSAVNVLPIASVEVSAKPITEQELRKQRQRLPSNPSSSKYVISQIPKSTFIPVFSSNSQPTTAGQSSSTKYREVDASNYHYGFNEHGDLRKRLIVYEDDRRYVREYNATETDRWKCINCKYGVARKDDEKFVVTFKHECAPIFATKSRELQAKYKSIAEMKVKNGNGRLPGPTPHIAANTAGNSEAPSRSSHDDMHFNLREKRPSSTSNNAITSSLREVHANDWKYGYDTAGEIEKRIIVFEPNTNHVYVREYRNDGPDTRCLGCAKERRLHARWVDNKLFVPYPDAHACRPRLYEEIKKRQKNNELKLGKKRERSPDRSLRSKRTRIAAEDTDTSNSPTTGEYEEHYNVVETPETFQSKKAVVVEKLREIIAPPSSIATMEFKNYLPSNHATVVNYYNPSAFFLSQCCKKLSIKYSTKAYQFWCNVECEQVSSLSRPYKTFPTSEAMYHGFSCFSLFLTGNESSSSLIREMTNRYIYNNFKSLGHCLGQDFSQFSHETPIIRETLWSFSLTEIHLECFSRWFDCRIGIYSDGNWKRYGNWDDEDCDVLTFLMQNKDGKYSPILSLTV